MPRARDPPDLFGDDRPKPPARGQVALVLVFHRDSESAWLLSQGVKGEPKWVPKSLARRGVGPEAHFWTLPSWKARELGWA